MSQVSPGLLNGNERLNRALSNERFSHAYVFIGSEGAIDLAKRAAKALMCLNEKEKPCGACLSCRAFDSGNNPDVMLVAPDKKKSIGADHIRDDVVTDAYIKPYNAAYKTYIIEQADLMTPAAQNVLLKTLEEPPPYSVFLLCAESEEPLLPTILSRCVKIRTAPPPPGEIMKKPKANDIRETVINATQDIEEVTAAEVLLRTKAFEEYKDEAGLLLDMMALWYRDLAVCDIGGKVYQTDILDRIKDLTVKHKNKRKEAARNIEFIEEARMKLSFNTSFLLTMEVLMLKLGRKIV